MDLQEGTVQAFCYLYQAGDEKNKCLLTANHLIVIHRSRRYPFEITDIRGIEFNTRRLMLPLLAGGIFAPLSLVAIFKELYDPWGLLLILFCSLFLFYYGWLGHTVMTVKATLHHRDFSIPGISTNLITFAGFVNALLSGKPGEGVSIYHVTPQKLWEAEPAGPFEPLSLQREGYIHCSAGTQLQKVVRDHFAGEKDLLLLKIDPLKVESEIRYEEGSCNGQLYPHIYGPLNRNAVVKTIPFHAGEIQSLLTSGL